MEDVDRKAKAVSVFMGLKDKIARDTTQPPIRASVRGQNCRSAVKERAAIDTAARLTLAVSYATTDAP